jgi:hypothetical protein
MNAVRTLNTANGIGMADRAGVTDRLLRRGVRELGGVGGGGIFVPMLALIIGFDPKSYAAMSKCMIMGASVSTVYYNLKLKHPTLDMPLIDYDLALLMQPMLMLGVSIGVIFNVIFADCSPDHPFPMGVLYPRQGERIFFLPNCR